MAKQYLIPILAVAALMTIPLWSDHADAQFSGPNSLFYPGLPDYETDPPPLGPACTISDTVIDNSTLPVITFESPSIETSNRGLCNELRSDAFILVYNSTEFPAKLVHREDGTSNKVTATLNLDDEKFGPESYHIFYFLTFDNTNYLTGSDMYTYDPAETPTDPDEMMTVATATLTIAPPPPEITSPPDGTQFLLTEKDQRINGTSIPDVRVYLNVTEINIDDTEGDTTQYDADSTSEWFFDVELYEGENRLTAWVEQDNIPSGTDEITLFVVNERLDAPEITSPENNARFANTDRTQTVRGTSDGDTVTLKLLEFDDGQMVNNMTHAGIVVGPEGIWSQEVELFESATTQLVATSHVGRITSPESERVRVHTTAAAVCSTGISANLAFGILIDGDTSSEETLSFENTGTQTSSHKVHGTDWVNPEQTTQVVMDVGQTKYHTTENTAYATKRTLTGTMADAVTGLASGATEDLYLQVQVDLDRDSFAGDIQQKITVSSSCG